MNKQTEAFKMAIEYLTNIQLDYKGHEVRKACKEALEQPSWQGLSDDEVNNIYPCAEGVHDFRDIVRAIEQALKEKNKC